VTVGDFFGVNWMGGYILPLDLRLEMLRGVGEAWGKRTYISEIFLTKNCVEQLDIGIIVRHYMALPEARQLEYAVCECG
jgi:hypothetical protein